MADKTLIAWTNHTANFWMGCLKISPGCKNCYAETLTTNRMGLRVWGPNSDRQGVKSIWNNLKKWNAEAVRDGRQHRVFVMSLGDFFEDHPSADRMRPLAWEAIRKYRALDFQILTKRPERIVESLPADWGKGYPNVWLGTSIENQDYAWRANVLRQIPAVVHFISYEPALGPLELDLHGIEWVICGGESGAKFRPMDLDWARSMRDQCRAAGVAYFFKQSSHRFTERGTTLDGETVREYPLPRAA